MNYKAKCYSYLRFSTPEQENGDSIRRQTAAADKWAAEHGYVLDDALRMEDRGLSAYHGKHITEDGALGKFLEAVKAGMVPKGSILLVESLDRLSRARVRDAQILLMQILQGGIDVVTLADSKRYCWETLDELQLILSIFIQSRAHEESQRKSERCSAAWSAKHEAARQTGKSVTSRVPGWLRLDKATRMIEVIPERAALVRRIFDEALEGSGADAISRRLNREKVPPWGPGALWNKTYVMKILTGGEVTGLYRPSKIKGGKKTPQEPVPLYYPAVIGKELFDQVNAAMKARTLGAGRTGKINNLFTHLARCGYCGAAMHYVAHGPNTRGGKRLVCSVAMSGKGCKYDSMSYEAFEQSFLKYCNELNLAEIISYDGRAGDVRQAQGDLDKINSMIHDNTARVEGLLATMAAITNKGMAAKLAQELNEAGDLQDGLEEKKAVAESKLETLTRPGNSTANEIELIKELQTKLDDPDEEARLLTRQRLKHAIARAVEQITCFPDGLQNRLPVFRKNGIELQEGPSSELNKECPGGMTVLWVDHLVQNTGRVNAAALVKFRNGHSRLFKWIKKTKSFIQVMVDAGTSTTMLFEGEGMIRIDKGPGNFEIPSK